MTDNSSNIPAYKSGLVDINFKGYFKVVSDLGELEDLYKTIDQFQDKNISGFSEKGVPIYKESFLVIFDDYYEPDLKNSKDVIKSFISGRHKYISSIFICQSNTGFINQIIKNNCEVCMLFNLNNRRTSDTCCLEYILNSIGKKYFNIKYDTIKLYSKKIYSDYVLKNKFGWLAIDQYHNQLYRPVGYNPDTTPKF